MNKYTEETVNDLSLITQAYDVSVAFGNAPIPTVGDLNDVLRIGSITLHRDTDYGLIEYSTKPIASSKYNDTIIVSVFPGLSSHHINEGKEQAENTQLLRSAIYVKRGQSQRVIDEVDFNCPGPYKGVATYVEALKDRVIKLLDKHA